MSVTPLPSPQMGGEMRRRWTADEFQRAVNQGIFRPEERLELLQGEIYEKMPPNPPHASLTDIIADLLRHLLPVDSCLRVEKPLILGVSAQPEPDIAVVRGTLRDYITRHPNASEALLVIEVSDATLSQDRGRKAGEYALAGIPEYWIVNLPERCVEVHRRSHLGQWQEVTRYADTATLSPLFGPTMALRVSEMLP